MSRESRKRRPIQEVTQQASDDADKQLALLEDITDPDLLATLLDIDEPNPIEDHLDLNNPDHRRYREIVLQAQRDMAKLLNKMPAKVRKIAVELTFDLSIAKTAERTESSPQTIKKYAELPEVKRYLTLARQRNQMMAAPTIADRLNMAWRIAQRNEVTDPKVSLSAIDLINKATGIYTPEDSKNKDTRPVVVLGNFTLNMHGAPVAQQKPEHDVIDMGPVEIDLSDD